LSDTVSLLRVARTHPRFWVAIWRLPSG
jgi:hypothetical protein